MKIYISYRPGMDTDAAYGVYRELSNYFREDAIIIDSIDDDIIGLDISEYISSQISSCAILLSVVGPGWVENMESLNDPNDIVTVELRSALEKNTPILPIHLEETFPLHMEGLSEDFQKFMRIRPITIYNRASHGLDRGLLSRIVDAVHRLTSNQQENVQKVRRARQEFPIYRGYEYGIEPDALDDDSTTLFTSRPLLDIRFIHGGTRILTGDNEGSVRLWNPNTVEFKEIMRCEVNGEYITCLSFSDDGRYVAAGFSGGAIKVWNCLNSNLVYSVDERENARIFNICLVSKNCLVFSDEKTGVYVHREGGPKGLERIVDEKRSKITRVEGYYRQVVVSPDDRRGFKIFDLDRHGEIGSTVSYENPEPNVLDVSFRCLPNQYAKGEMYPARTGKSIAIVAGSSLSAWDVDEDIELWRHEIENMGAIWRVELSPTGTRVVVSFGMSSEFHLYNAVSGEKIAESDYSGFLEAEKFAFSPDGRYLVGVNKDVSFLKRLLPGDVIEEAAEDVD